MGDASGTCGGASDATPAASATAASAATEDDTDDCLLIRVHVPELNVHKCLQFSRDQLVWDVKQQCLASLPKELKESFNYGLFCPPANGRAGKFLDEERRLGEYAWPDVGSTAAQHHHLELKYKRRVYKLAQLDEKQLRSLHTRANLRRLLDYVQNAQVEKIAKMCGKGLDPNFHCADTGETPLSLAAGAPAGPRRQATPRILAALVNGGALLDYRTRDGGTALHRAAAGDSLEAVRALLELGASPNARDQRGLTPLYTAVQRAADARLLEALLHDRAALDRAQDAHGWHETHHACKLALRPHLEHLLFYGAALDARNASGNTPLHVCAVQGADECARTLLFRGADPHALNYANQTAYQVAVIAGNLELAELIQNYRPDQVVLALGVADKARTGDHSDIVSDSSGVGTANSDTTNCSSLTSTSLHHPHQQQPASGDSPPPSSRPPATVVCVEPYRPEAVAVTHLPLNEGDIIEVTGEGDGELLEGRVRGPGGGALGFFPASHVQEVRLRQGAAAAAVAHPLVVHYHHHQQQQRERVAGRREQHFATAPRLKKPPVPLIGGEARGVVLHRAKKGFGFVLRGAKATSPLMELTPSDKCPALQYLDDVDPGGVADMAGLRRGDFLVQINGEDVTTASHEHVVDLIRRGGDLVSMTVVSLSAYQQRHRQQYRRENEENDDEHDNSYRQQQLPSSKSTAALPAAASQQQQQSRLCATLPRRLQPAAAAAQANGPPLPPRRDPKTTLSVGRARAKSMVAGLENGETDAQQDTPPPPPIDLSSQQPRTASIRARPTSGRITAAELEELFQRQRDTTDMMSTSQFRSPPGRQPPVLPAVPAPARVYASVAEMKRGSRAGRGGRVHFKRSAVVGAAELRRDFHSTPDLAHRSPSPPPLTVTAGVRIGRVHRSHEDVAAYATGLHPRAPPPTHPPPPPPLGQLVTVDVSRHAASSTTSEYEVATSRGTTNAHPLAVDDVASSFRPAASAKLYASPEDVKTVGYRSRSLPSHVRKTQSMRATQPATCCTRNGNGGGTLPTRARNLNNPYAQPKVNTSRRRQQQQQQPPIPEPDYSLSESSDSEDGRRGEQAQGQVARRAGQVQVTTVREEHVVRLHVGSAETSGGSSNSSAASMHHSFSVDEIQRVRTRLKSSKSYPNELAFHKRAGETASAVAHQPVSGADDDCDNSSSGVSSDQENGVSLAQLPPPPAPSRAAAPGAGPTLPAAVLFLPPPPEFEPGTASPADALVLAPPPQFCDQAAAARARVVGAVPKAAGKQGRLHSH